MIFAATVLSWAVVLAGLWLARLKIETHREFVVPGLALIALLLGIESAELAALAALADWTDGVASFSVTAVIGVRLLTLLRYGTLLGFWLGVRYSRRPLDAIETAPEAFAFAFVGWRQFGRLAWSTNDVIDR